MVTANETSVAFDYKKLRAKIVEEGKTHREVAKAAGITPTTFSLRINNHGVFTQDQIISICEFLEIEIVSIPRYFFALKV